MGQAKQSEYSCSESIVPDEPHNLFWRKKLFKKLFKINEHIQTNKSYAIMSTDLFI
jgi:hypothetical protein